MDINLCIYREDHSQTSIHSPILIDPFFFFSLFFPALAFPPQYISAFSPSSHCSYFWLAEKLLPLITPLTLFTNQNQNYNQMRSSRFLTSLIRRGAYSAVIFPLRKNRVILGWGIVCVWGEVDIAWCFHTLRGIEKQKSQRKEKEQNHKQGASQPTSTVPVRLL